MSERDDEEPVWPTQLDPMWAELNYGVYEEAIRLARHGDMEMLLSELRDDGPITVQSKRMIADLIGEQLKPKRAKKPVTRDYFKLYEIIATTENDKILRSAILQMLVEWYITDRRMKKALRVFSVRKSIEASVQIVRGVLEKIATVNPSLLERAPSDDDLTQMLADRLRRKGTKPI